MSSDSVSILLLGASGQVGHHLCRTLDPLGSVNAPGRDTVDLTVPETLDRAVHQSDPDVVVNAAAYTDVDGAEAEPDRAATVNAEAPGVLAAACASVGAWLVQYSTDYVFDGTRTTPYTEEHGPNPINVYGHTKLNGENAVRAAGGPHLILRTSWVYSVRRSNFLRTMLRLAEERDRISVVDDQIGTPTWAGWIAEATATVVQRLRTSAAAEEWSGTYHMAAAGQTSWYSFARAIFSYVRSEDLSVERTTSDEHPTAAPRPAYTALDSGRLRRTFDVAVPPWSEQLARLHAQTPASTTPG